MIKAVIFDLGHTIIDENSIFPDIKLMPGVREVLQKIPLKKGIWANTKVHRGIDVRQWLKKVAVDQYFDWVFTSVDAGVRKPGKKFFSYCLKKCNLDREEVLFIGNQLNTDIKGALDYGIKNVWLSDPRFRSVDDTHKNNQVKPTYSIESLEELPDRLKRII